MINYIRIGYREIHLKRTKIGSRENGVFPKERKFSEFNEFRKSDKSLKYERSSLLPVSYTRHKFEMYAGLTAAILMCPFLSGSSNLFLLHSLSCIFFRRGGVMPASGCTITIFK